MTIYYCMVDPSTHRFSMTSYIENTNRVLPCINQSAENAGVAFVKRANESNELFEK